MSLPDDPKEIWEITVNYLHFAHLPKDDFVGVLCIAGTDENGEKDARYLQIDDNGVVEIFEPLPEDKQPILTIFASQKMFVGCFLGKVNPYKEAIYGRISVDSLTRLWKMCKVFDFTPQAWINFEAAGRPQRPVILTPNDNTVEEAEYESDTDRSEIDLTYLSDTSSYYISSASTSSPFPAFSSSVSPVSPNLDLRFSPALVTRHAHMLSRRCSNTRFHFNFFAPFFNFIPVVGTQARQITYNFGLITANRLRTMQMTSMSAATNFTPSSPKPRSSLPARIFSHIRHTLTERGRNPAPILLESFSLA
eukprot:TRINITY_DN2010_c0_g1::TRINITY_DN2010_c0_g1_i1::g.21940::m.21940 TRINITY_DN2010_c0_g1::TRINITY_DN2010_c0_g1_i1::g.21940  ORF type:complete len:307 (+),score=49.07 TRINITY_DN2010_c0_g1_i1:130-1050(+)